MKDGKPGVWSKAHHLYMYIKKDIVIKFPKEESYELVLQSQIAALPLPIPLNYEIINKLINETRAMLIAFIKFLRR